MRNNCLVIKCIKLYVYRMLAEAIYKCRHLLLLFWSEVVNYLLLSWLCPWSRVFMRAGFVIPLLVSYPAMNISYLSLPNCSGNFNRFARHYALDNAFELHFVVRVLLHHRLRFNHLPQSRYYLQLLLQYISDWSPGEYCECAFYRENKLILYNSCLYSS